MATAMRTRLLAAVFCASVCGLGVTVGARQSAQVSGASVPVIINNDAPGKDETRFVQEGFVLTPVNGYAAGYMSDTAYLNNEALPRANGANASWKFQIAANGKCTFAATWGALNKGSIDTKYTTSKTGDTPILADQSKPAPTKLDMTGDGVIDDRGWLVLGNFDVKTGETVTVTVKGGTKGYTLADAVMMNCNMTVLGDGPTSCMMPVCAPPAPGCEYVRDSAVDANGCPLRPCGELKCNTTVAAVCGNGKIEGKETCDDANRNSNDGCSSQCTKEFCGDNIRNNDPNEQCDGKASVQQNEVCNAQCKIEFCGDGVIQPAKESCDDGNAMTGDGCDAQCKTEKQAPCGYIVTDSQGNKAPQCLNQYPNNCNALGGKKFDTLDLCWAASQADVGIALSVADTNKIPGSLTVSMNVSNKGPLAVQSPFAASMLIPGGYTFDPTQSSKDCAVKEQSRVACTINALSPTSVQYQITFTVAAAACKQPIVLEASTSTWGTYPLDSNSSNNISRLSVTPSCPITVTACTDTDGGENKDVRGTVTGLEMPNVSQSWTDYCGSVQDEAGMLAEYVCQPNNYAKKVLLPCPNGCADGACKKAPQDPNACAFPENKNTGTLSVDVDMNGVVESRDIRLVIAAYNEVQRTNVIPTSVYDPEAQTPVLIAVKPDVDGNLTVDVQDVLYVLHYVRCSVPRVSLTQANVSCVGTDTKAALTYEARNTNPLIVMLENGSWLYNGGDVTASKTSATVTTFENVLVPAGSKIKLCDNVNKTLCSSAVTIVGAGCPKNISLAGVTLTTDGGVASAKVAYTKDPFPTCVHMFIATDKSKTLHTVNYFCSTTGETKTVPLGPTAANQNDGLKVKEGDSVVLCHGNNSGICSAPVTVTKEGSAAGPFTSITNANPDADNTNVPTGVSPMGQFKFLASAAGAPAIEKATFSISTTNVVLDGVYKLYDKSDSTRKTTCTFIGGGGMNGSDGNATVTFTATVECANLSTSGILTSFAAGASKVLVLETNVTNPHTSSLAPSTARVTLQSYVLTNGATASPNVNSTLYRT